LIKQCVWVLELETTNFQTSIPVIKYEFLRLSEQHISPKFASVLLTEEFDHGSD
jgi:hypothetical protein